MLELKIDSSMEEYTKAIKLAIGVCCHYCGRESFADKTLYFTKNDRLSKAWARCCYGKIYGHRNNNINICTIECSRFIEGFNTKLLIGIFVHELLHALFPRDGHRGEWARYAQIITSDTDFDIQVHVTEEERENAKNAHIKYKYELYCDTCGKVVAFTDRKVSYVRNPNSCYCRTCKNSPRLIVNF